ncbi:quaternary amine ABC transporter ATP-binding protein [Pseudomonas cremoricolorata]|uniref:quaternary amine ABC transporter ATP-binding protein n=1 Tax=Pseudomonas cremoricolorata TaxID=157783 RepID=UPI00040E444C|nr:betaine/proline/choline family ABC transporter ATP-binding protein [Pseudomonas cremoricolorata]
MNSSVACADEVLVSCRGVWKVFGKHVDEAIEASRDRGVSKKQILHDHGCVIGVSDVSLEVKRGEIFCIMGLSGSGKSTLIRLLNKLIVPSAGQVLVKGQDLATLDGAALRKVRSQHIGMVFQSVALLPHRSVLENVAFGLEVQGVSKHERHAAAQQSLEKVGLSDWATRFPGELSGGMQQRVGLARVLTCDPEIILMDEPFSALDPLIRRQLQDEFRGLTKSLGKSAVFITHDLEEAIRLGDRIAIMKDGVIIQVGSAEDIVLKPADAYVADFVAGISRLHLVRAHSVMSQHAQWAARHPHIDLAALPVAGPQADLDELINLLIQSGAEALLIVEGGQPVGVVTPTDLLRGVQGSESEEGAAVVAPEVQA